MAGIESKGSAEVYEVPVRVAGLCHPFPPWLVLGWCNHRCTGCRQRVQGPVDVIDVHPVAEAVGGRVRAGTDADAGGAARHRDEAGLAVGRELVGLCEAELFVEAETRAQ